MITSHSTEITMKLTEEEAKLLIQEISGVYDTLLHQHDNMDRVINLLTFKNAIVVELNNNDNIVE